MKDKESKAPIIIALAAMGSVLMTVGAHAILNPFPVLQKNIMIIGIIVTCITVIVFLLYFTYRLFLIKSIVEFWKWLISPDPYRGMAIGFMGVSVFFQNFYLIHLNIRPIPALFVLAWFAVIPGGISHSRYVFKSFGWFR